MKRGWLNRLFGDHGERIAARFLKRNGYRILRRQARGPFGEIDLIAKHQDTIVFVEVKTRKSTNRGHPSEAVTDQKQRQISRAALAWLKKNNLLNHRCRFDVIAILHTPGQEPEIKHIVHAFESTERS
ncbi:YraN family protein [Thalassoglobus sp. JC818]|uniref:YraN family protein n=1 Tax=Thalassoglobus sp. JC818 TaxID=3232136 RepID=UPI00345A8984